MFESIQMDLRAQFCSFSHFRVWPFDGWFMVCGFIRYFDFIPRKWRRIRQYFGAANIKVTLHLQQSTNILSCIVLSITTILALENVNSHAQAKQILHIFTVYHSIFCQNNILSFSSSRAVFVKCLRCIFPNLHWCNQRNLCEKRHSIRLIAICISVLLFTYSIGFYFLCINISISSDSKIANKITSRFETKSGCFWTRVKRK